ncbi:MAG: DegT/DnrJ/EryC1/StrS family aminotransferase [bacterium]|nr:DegT/DnrJ/EryC1/StrS family aminotransferase [bacterium]
MKVPLSRPEITELDRRAVLGILDGPTLALGPRLVAFEEAMAKAAGTQFAVAVSSGTAALHLVVRALGMGQGDEVITTPFSFVASANTILYERATPVFVDILDDTLCISPDLIEAAITPRTRAILAVDVFGQPAALDRIREIASRRGLLMIEDACESLGSAFQGLPAGNGRWAEAATFAFYPNKQITTGEGGCIVTDSKEIYRLCRSMRNQGRSEQGGWLDHERLGYNYRMAEMNAALGLAQVSRLDDIIASRQSVASRWAERLAPLAERGLLRLPWIHPAVTRMSWFVYVVRLAPEIDRDAVLRDLLGKGVECRPYFTPIHLQPFYREMGYQEGMYPVTEAAGRQCLALPFFNTITDEELDYAADALRRALDR